MPRKQVGAIDADLLLEVDRRAEFLGQTRRVFIERALRQRLNDPIREALRPTTYRGGFDSQAEADEAARDNAS